MKKIIITVTDENSIEFVTDDDITLAKSVQMLAYAQTKVSFIREVMNGLIATTDARTELSDAQQERTCVCGHRDYDHPKLECSIEGCNCMALQL